MYAVIETGEKQYYVKEGDVIEVEILKDTQNDSQIAFKNILFLHNGSTGKMGTPYVSEGVVMGQVLQKIRGPKLFSFKYKRRKNYRRKVGHRQNYLQVKITEIKG